MYEFCGCVGVKTPGLVGHNHVLVGNLRAFTTDTASQLDILGHDSHTLGMDSTQVSIFKETNKVGFRSFLESQHSRSLESKITLKVLSNLTNQSLERKLADEQVSGLLVTANLL